MKLQYILFICSGFLLVNFLAAAEGYQVTCYICDSTVDKQCTEKAPPTTLKTQTYVLTDSHYERSVYPACRKEVYRNESIWPAVTWVVRSPVDLPNADGDSCEFKQISKRTSVNTCWCKGNYCNGSPNTSSVTHTFVALCVIGSVLAGYIRK